MSAMNLYTNSRSIMLSQLHKYDLNKHICMPSFSRHKQRSTTITMCNQCVHHAINAPKKYATNDNIRGLATTNPRNCVPLYVLVLIHVLVPILVVQLYA